MGFSAGGVAEDARSGQYYFAHIRLARLRQRDEPVKGIWKILRQGSSVKEPLRRRECVPVCCAQVGAFVLTTHLEILGILAQKRRLELQSISNIALRYNVPV